MAPNPPSHTCFVPKTKEEEEEDERIYYQKYTDLLSTLPRAKSWATEQLYQYQGFWYHTVFGLEGSMRLLRYFKAQPTDVFLINSPKSGTTWLKALIFSIVNRAHYKFHTHPLLTFSPDECVPILELDLYRKFPIANPDVVSLPRLFATHIPFSSLPKSVNDLGCQIVYICRDPKDVFVSLCHFINKLRSQDLPPLSLEEGLDFFCEGLTPFGPFWDHVLGYWKASLKWPKRVLFFKYEDMLREPLVSVKRLAEFLGYPFTLEEEREGLAEEILKFCSFENLSNWEANNKMMGLMSQVGVGKAIRRGKVGDWKNELTAEMIERLDQITEEKLADSGLTFD